MWESGYARLKGQSLASNQDYMNVHICSKNILCFFFSLLALFNFYSTTARQRAVNWLKWFARRILDQTSLKLVVNSELPFSTGPWFCFSHFLIMYSSCKPVLYSFSCHVIFDPIDLVPNITSLQKQTFDRLMSSGLVPCMVCACYK